MNFLIRVASLAICFQLIFGVYPIGQYAYANGSKSTHQNFTSKQHESEFVLYDEGALEGLEEKAREMIRTAASDPGIKQEINGFLAELSEKDVLTTKRYMDPFLLGNQEIKINDTGERIALNSVSARSAIPSLSVAFKGDVEFENDFENKRFSIKYIRNDKVEAEHRFIGREIVDFYADASHIYTLEKSGAIFAAPKKIMEQAAFNSPVPWVKIAQLNKQVMNHIRSSQSQVEIFGATAGQKPFDSIYREGVFPVNESGVFANRWEAGDLIVRLNHSDGTNEALGIYSFGAIRKNANVGLQVLARKVDILLENADLSKGIYPGESTEDFKRQSRKRVEMDNNLLRMERNVFDSILIEAYNSKFLYENSPQRHIIKAEELNKDYEVLMQNARAKGVSEESLELELRDNWDQYVLGTEKVQKTFWQKYGTALLVMGGLATIGVADYSFYLLKNGFLAEAPVWALNSLTKVYEFVGHHFLDVDYMWANIGSMLFLVSLVPILYFTAKWQGQKIGKKPAATILHYSLKLWALVLYPFFRALSKAAGQPVFLDAMRAGANPFAKVKANSEMGKKLGLEKDVRVGVSKYIFSDDKANKDESVKVKRNVVAEIAAVDSRKQALAFVLGAGIAAKKHGIDIDVMYKAIQKRQQLEIAFAKVGKGYENKEEILREANRITPNKKQQALLDSIDYMKEVDLATKDIYIMLLKMKKVGLKDLKEVSQEELNSYRELAEETIEFYGKKPLLRKAKHIGHFAKEGLRRNYIGNAGANSAFEFFWNVNPSNEIVEEYWNGFKSDYVFSAVQMGLVAARSWHVSPVALAADPSAFGMTYVPHTAATGEQIAIHMLPAAADKTYTFAEKVVAKFSGAVLEDVRYKPAEYVSLRGEVKEESKRLSSWNILKRAGNLVQANYPMVFARSQYNSFRTMRAGMTIGLPTLTAAGLDLSSAIASYLYISLGKIWAFTAYWYIEGHSVIEHKRFLTKENDLLRQAKADIAQGIRMNDTDKILRGTEGISELFKRHSYAVKSKHKTNMDVKLKKIGKELGLSPLEEAQYRKMAMERVALIAQVSNAIESGNPAEIEAAERSLRHFADYPEEFKDGKVHSVEEGKALLRYVMYNPPVKAKMNTAVHLGLLYFGAFLTTYLATGFFAEAVDKEIPKWDLLIQKGVVYTATFYAIIFGAQFGLKFMSKAYSKIKEKNPNGLKFVDSIKRRTAKLTRRVYVPKSCKLMFSKANRGKN